MNAEMCVAAAPETLPNPKHEKHWMNVADIDWHLSITVFRVTIYDMVVQ